MIKRMGALAVALVSIFGVSVSRASSEPFSFHLPEPIVDVLPNGLKLVWFVDDKLPIVDLSLVIESGNRWDPAGKSGTAELLSDLLERGSAGRSAQEVAKRVERLGASGGASCEEEAISVSMHGLSQDADELLSIAADMALRPNFDASEFSREKEKLAEGWNHMADSAEALSGFAFARAVLGGTPYARGSLQDLANLRRVKLEDLRAFHRRHFTPRNAVLLVVGRVDRKAYRARIDSLFGGWKGAKPTRTDVRFTDPRFVGKRGPEGDIFLVDRPDLPQAQVRIGFPVPGLHSKSRYALAVGNALLGEYFNSRLNLVVRDQMGLAYGIQSGISYLKDYAFLSIASATSSANTGKLIEETLRQLRLARAGDFLAQEVETSKAYLIGGFPLGLSTLSAVASRWLGGYRFDMGPDYLNSFIPKVAAVTREKVVNAVNEAFALDRMVIVVSGSAGEIEKSLREKGFKRIRRISAKSLL